MAARKKDPARHKETPERTASATIWLLAKADPVIRGVSGSLDPEHGGTPSQIGDCDDSQLPYLVEFEARSFRAPTCFPGNCHA